MTIFKKSVETAKVGTVGAVKRRGKYNMAPQLLEGARLFAEQAAAMEQVLEIAEPREPDEVSKHRTLVVGAIVLAFMGLEACMNEVYLDATDHDMQKLKGLDERETGLLAVWWPRLESSHADPLLKARHALLLLGKADIPEGQCPHQDAQCLKVLRNALTHYKPEWEDMPLEQAPLEKRLRGRFDPNPLAAGNAIWFPHRCLGSGCARWAVDTAEAFTRTFCVRLGIKERA
jgi:hypothetical protein